MQALAEVTRDFGGESSVAELTRSILPLIAQRAAAIDDSDSFVAENYALLKEAGLVRAGVPAELGGLGADVAELAAMLKSIAHVCGSTALAFSMHTHQVAIPAWRWRHQKAMAVEPLLKRVAAEQITPYPPGIPVVVPGEQLNDAVIDYLRSGAQSGMNLPDASDPRAEQFLVVTQ